MLGEQQGDPESTLSFTRRLLALRASTPALQGGSQRALPAGQDVFCYLRELDEERLLVALNFSSRRVRVKLPDDLDSRATLELSTYPARDAGAIELRTLTLEPDEGVIVSLG